MYIPLKRLESIFHAKRGLYAQIEDICGDGAQARVWSLTLSLRKETFLLFRTHFWGNYFFPCFKQQIAYYQPGKACRNEQRREHLDYILFMRLGAELLWPLTA